MSRLRIMSQNQWNYVDNLPNWQEMGLDCSAEVRMKGHVKVMKELLPDILGGQEVNIQMQTLFQFYAMEEKLPYALIWGNYTPIIYRTDKFELLDTEYIYYPDEVEGFEGIFNGAVRSKGCCVGVFRAKEDGKVFVFATTHLWWMNGSDPNHKSYKAGSNEARMMQIKMALELVEKYQKKYNACPVFFVGDMNCGYESGAIQYALKEGGYVHAHDVAVEYACENMGYNICGPKGPGLAWLDKPFAAAIDHILVKDLPEKCVRRFERYMTEAYLVLSDHAPVYIDVEL